MIVRPRNHFWEQLVTRPGGVLPKIWQPLLLLVLWSAAIAVVHHDMPRLVPGHVPGPYTLLGVALSIFLSFRNNACYARWWEGRCQWGHLISSIRNFERQLLILEPTEADERQHLLQLVTGFCYALVGHLRPSFGFDAANQWLSLEEQNLVRGAVNRPNAIVRMIGLRLAELKISGRISDISFQLLDHSVQQFVAVQGSCDRIRSTTVPFSYNQLLQQTTFILLLGLPFGFVSALGPMIVVGELFLGYVFLGLDVLGDELEEPFGDQPNKLPIAALAKFVEIEMRSAMGETELPEKPVPVGFVIM
jgi:putative membrane protein